MAEKCNCDRTACFRNKGDRTTFSYNANDACSLGKWKLKCTFAGTASCALIVHTSTRDASLQEADLQSPLTRRKPIDIGRGGKGAVSESSLSTRLFSVGESEDRSLTMLSISSCTSCSTITDAWVLWLYIACLRLRRIKYITGVAYAEAYWGLRFPVLFTFFATAFFWIVLPVDHHWNCHTLRIWSAIHLAILAYLGLVTRSWIHPHSLEGTRQMARRNRILYFADTMSAPFLSYFLLFSKSNRLSNWRGVSKRDDVAR